MLASNVSTTITEVARPSRLPRSCDAASSATTGRVAGSGASSVWADSVIVLDVGGHGLGVGRALEPVQTACVARAGELIECALAAKLAVVVDARELGQGQLREH